MRSSARSLFTTIRTEGAILPSELLERIAKGKDFDGLSTDSYHLLAGQKLNEAIERSWKQVLVAWRGFNEAREKSGDLDATGTSLTRERWLYPLFQELGFGRMPAERKAREIDGREYAISHFYDHVPVHMVGYKILIDRRTPGIPGAAKTAPHSLVQEFLNRTEEHLWAIVSNGLRLRLLRDNKSLTRQAYVEFDLEAMLQGDAFADFRVLWLLCHQSRFEAEKPTDCWLEKWSKIASEQGVRALDKLRGGVEEAIRALGKGFLAHPANKQLKARLRDGQLDRQEYYRQVLRVVYRLLFLFVAEDRDLLLLPELQGDEPDEAKRQRRLARARYQQHYGTQRLRGLSQTIRGTQHPDLWRGLQLIMRGLGQEGGIPALAVPALGSYLWSDAACPDLAGMNATPAADIANIDLLVAVRALAVIEVEGRRTVVNYAHLRSEELGSVYESLLELHPNLNAEAGTFDLHSAAGNERKTTGSYYTPDSLVQCLLDSALEPVMDEKEALAKKVAQKIASGRVERSEWSAEELDLIIPRGADSEEALAARMVELLNMDPADRHRTLREAALLGMRVCDPACGSGHFLIAAAHRIARRVARVRTGDEEPTPEALQHAMRDVVGRCLYGVDINAMALELAKVALWMEAIEPGKPLGFLDAHFQCGNALLGTTPDLIAGGLPDGAFTALTGDDKKFVSALKKRNKQEREGGQQEFLTASGSAIPVEVFEELAKGAQALFEANADSLADVQRIAANYDEFRQSPAFRRARFVADLWCAAFVWPKVEPGEWQDRIRDADEKGLPLPGPRDYPEPPTHDLIQRCAQYAEPWKLLSDAQRDMLDRLTDQFRFIQWHVIFADVFRTAAEGEKAQGGFDCMLGNPPWERVKLQEKEFFAQRAPEIANAANAAARKRAIDQLAETDPDLLAEFAEAQRQAEGESHLMRSSGVYPLCGRGDINVYTIFAELGRLRLSLRGLMGVVLPSGIATDDTTKFYFQNVINTHSLVSLFDLENRLGLFPAVDSRMKFCLFTCGSGRGVPAGRKPGQAADFVFFAHAVEDIRDPERRFRLTAEDIKTLNPNTMTCPVFRTRKDAELTKAIYRRVPVLIREKTSDQPEENPWGLRFMAMFHMANDSGLFHTREQLEGMGYVLEGNIFVKDDLKAAALCNNPGANRDVSEAVYGKSGRVYDESGLDHRESLAKNDKTGAVYGETGPNNDEPAAIYDKSAPLSGDPPPDQSNPPRFLPLYEAKLFHQFDHRFATYTESLDTKDVEAEEKAEADYTILPRYWVSEAEVLEKLEKRDKGVERERERERATSAPFCAESREARITGRSSQRSHLAAASATRRASSDTGVARGDERPDECNQRAHNDHRRDSGDASRAHGSALHSGWSVFRDIVRGTDERTIISDVLPRCPMNNTAPLMLPNEAMKAALLTANLNSIVLDFCARSAIGGTHLSYFILKQLPVLAPGAYKKNQSSSDLFGSILELLYTAWDLEPFARDCGYDGPPFIWDEERRFLIRAELDAAFFHLYLGTPEEWTRTGSPELLESFPTPRHAVDYIMETFPIVKRKDEKAHGTYRTKEAILDIYDQMAEAIRTGQPYETALNPPPGPPTDTEGNFIPMTQWDANNWPKHIHPPKEAPVEVEVPAVAAVATRIPIPGLPMTPWDGRTRIKPGRERYFRDGLAAFVAAQGTISIRDAQDAVIASTVPAAVRKFMSDGQKVRADRILTMLADFSFPEDSVVRLREVEAALIERGAITKAGVQYEVGTKSDDFMQDSPFKPELVDWVRLVHEVIQGQDVEQRSVIINMADLYKVA